MAESDSLLSLSLSLSLSLCLCLSPSVSPSEAEEQLEFLIDLLGESFFTVICCGKKMKTSRYLAVILKAP